MNVISKSVVAERSAAALCSRTATGTVRLPGSQTQSVTWQLPEEVPVALQINSEPFTVMMATPANLRDFAAGFLIGEGLITSVKHIKGVLEMPVEGGLTVDVAVDEDKIDPARIARRTIEGRTGCGLCGVEDIAAAVRPLPVLARDWAPADQAIRRGFLFLPDHQPMNKQNRSVHGAAWVSRTGEILMVREDVGRHNALDKLIGALLLSDTDFGDGFVLMTSRCSFELVQKAVTAGIFGLATVSAPTALALQLARQSNLFLAALGPGGPVVFNP